MAIGCQYRGREEEWKENTSKRRQSWRPAVSEDRPLNHRTEFHLAFRLLSTESTTYLPVDLDLLRSDAPPPPPPPFPSSVRGPCSLYRLPPYVFPSGPFLIFSPFASVRAPYAVGRPACCTFHGCLQLWIMNIDNTAGQEETDDRSNVNISATLRALAVRAFSSPFSALSFLGDPPFSSIPRGPVHFASFDLSTLPTTTSARKHSCWNGQTCLSI